MHHNNSLIATIAVSLAFAFVGGFIASKLRLPPLVGYLLAGIAVGPFTPGFVADAHLAPQLAEIGVILLMFGVGMHFSLRDLMAVKFIAVPGAIAQMAAATGMGIGAAYYWQWPLGAGVVLGLALSVASTVVLLRSLEARNQVGSDDGKIAVGWLIVEDLVMVLVLVLLPALAPSLGGVAPESGGSSPGEIAQGSLWVTLGVTLGKVVAFVALMLILGAKAFPYLLRLVERTGSRELFTLAVTAIALGVAYGSAELFGVSFALGAFFAGIVVNESDLSHRAAKDLQPLQDAFAVLFFVAVGMLFDPRILLQEPWRVLAVVAIVVAGKFLAAMIIVLAFRRTVSTALRISVSLAQIGEFSFILAELGIGLKLLPEEGRSLVLAGALFSITINPLIVALADRLHLPSQPAAVAA